MPPPSLYLGVSMSSRVAVDPRFPARLRALRGHRGLSLRALAALALSSKSLVHQIETGGRVPTLETARLLDDALRAGGELRAMVSSAPQPPPAFDATDVADTLDAVELARRVEASDVGAVTLARLELAVDDLAIAYAMTSPEELLPRVRRHLAYVARLIDGRKTLDQHRRLLVLGGWLSLLGATLHIDLRQSVAAEARLVTAAQLAEHAGHAEITAWCLETRAWDVLTDGEYQQAVALSRQAQTVAPSGSSVHIQATAQEGRAWARMGRQGETRAALDRVARLVGSLPVPERPEHHYRYDPDKALSYTATTLAWAGDPAAEEYARAVITQLDGSDVARPRRIASARLDLGLALLAAGKPDEASAETLVAITSGRVVPSNWWRATEVVSGVTLAGTPDADELREAYEAHRPAVTSD